MTITRCGRMRGSVVRAALLVLLGFGPLLPLSASAGTVDAKLDALEAKADVIEAKLDALELKADSSTSAIAALEGKGDAVESKIDNLAANVSALEAKLDAIEVKLDQLAARPVGAPAFSHVMLAALAGLLTIMGVKRLRRRTTAQAGAQ